MSDTDAIDLALVLFRCGIGAVMLAHGINHVIGGGALLILGLLTPLGGASVVGVMTVAWAINHRGNGFFIFRPGEGWEYVMTLVLCGLLIGTIGPGQWSLDDAVFDDDLLGTTGLAMSAIAGFGGAALLLAIAWRPPTK